MSQDTEHYETVAPSQTDQVLGGTGAAGDFLDTLTVVVATAATATVSLKDGTTAVPASGGIFPASPGGGIGTYVLAVKARSQKGAWSVTTGAGVSVLATGSFT